jgi:hypothetical protein
MRKPTFLVVSVSYKDSLERLAGVLLFYLNPNWKKIELPSLSWTW